MTTGVRRGELCAIRWSRVELDPERPTVWLRTAIRKEDRRLVEAALKTHQQRRIAVDLETAEVLREHRSRCAENATALGLEFRADRFVFPSSPDGLQFQKPDSVTQRYERLAARLGIRTTIHKLRHYSATELILGGVDVRTVAGQLGHGGGGTTTLRTYTAWVSEADQRAAAGLGAGMPARPEPADAVARTRLKPRYPYEQVAAAIAARVDRGELPPGNALPTAAELAAEHDVALSTARRAVVLLESWGYVRSGAGRPVVMARAEEQWSGTGAFGTVPTAHAERWLATLRGAGGHRYPPRVVSGCLSEPDDFRGHLIGIARIEEPQSTDDSEGWVEQFELEIVPVDRSGVNRVVLRW